MELIIDGKTCKANPGDSILNVARREGIAIPTLCYHEAFGGQGSCRLCTVEVTAGGRSRLVASCTYPVSEGIEVKTSTPAVEKIRRNIIMMLYKRASGSVLMQKLYREYGCSENSLGEKEEERCIVCRLCVLACEKMGTSAISTVMRGIDKRVGTPYDQAATACIGCAACAHICPTGAIEVLDSGNTRTIWNKNFNLINCERCGQPFATREQIDHVSRLSGIEDAELCFCEECRRKKLAGKMQGFSPC